MTYTPFAHAESLRIATVDFVSPDEIKALLDIEAPESVALNAGGATPFPRVNGYVLMPVDGAYLIGQVEWITVERSTFPKRRGVQDFGIIDLPYPLRRMRLNPLGTLSKSTGTEETYRFRRGADVLPSIGTAVLLPTDRQLHAIVESGDNRHVRIGVSPLAANAVVSVDPDRMFGRHLAVLGNTGSGKSCTVAGLIRWSLDAASGAREGGLSPNARFIVLDPNGEYASAFGTNTSGNAKTRVFRVTPGQNESALRVPLWFWNSAEWASFTQASEKTQRPVLNRALELVRHGKTVSHDASTHLLRNYLRTLVSTVRAERASGAPWGPFPKNKGFFEKLDKWQGSLESLLDSIDGAERAAVCALVDVLDNLCLPRRRPYAQFDFTREEVDELLEALSGAHSSFGGVDSDVAEVGMDTPRPFNGNDLLRCVEGTAEMMNVSPFTETLLVRIRSLLQDIRLAPVISDEPEVTLDRWLHDIVGDDGASRGCIAVLDLSLVPADIIHVLTAVVARVAFEALQRYRRLNRTVLPTVLVMEEAHTFVKRYKEDAENHDAASICCQVFERIAREGRKFGLGLVLSSQRPSELSPTVLSQCNTFLLHRISNDRDQELVHKLLPDSLHGLMRELPSLPSQHAILLGWASELPVLVKIDDLPDGQRPESDDPDFWSVWTGSKQRAVDWKSIADEWQGKPLATMSDQADG